MITDCLDIRIHGIYLHIGNLKDPLTLDNVFFTLNWTADETSNYFHNEYEVINIYRGFGHPSIRGTVHVNISIERFMRSMPEVGAHGKREVGA